jgi:hypothetical protein
VDGGVVETAGTAEARCSLAQAADGHGSFPRVRR